MANEILELEPLPESLAITLHRHLWLWLASHPMAVAEYMYDEQSNYLMPIFKHAYFKSKEWKRAIKKYHLEEYRYVNMYNSWATVGNIHYYDKPYNSCWFCSLSRSMQMDKNALCLCDYCLGNWKKMSKVFHPDIRAENFDPDTTCEDMYDDIRCLADSMYFAYKDWKAVEDKKAPFNQMVDPLKQLKWACKRFSRACKLMAWAGMTETVSRNTKRPYSKDFFEEVDHEHWNQSK